MDDEELKAIKDLEFEKNKLLLEEVYWHMNSRVVWIIEGEQNTNFFHNFASCRKHKNTILEMQDEEGRKVKTFSEMVDLG